MAQVFLSYARADHLIAKKLAAWLQAEGWTVWWDTHILAGSTFRSKIEAELAAAQRVIVIWTKTSIDSKWVIDEAQAGADRGVLLPIVIDDARIPLGLRQLQAVRLSSNFDRNHSGITALRNSLGAPPRPSRQSVESGAQRAQATNSLSEAPVGPSVRFNRANWTAPKSTGGFVCQWLDELHGWAQGLVVLIIMALGGACGIWLANHFAKDGLIMVSATLVGAFGLLFLVFYIYFVIDDRTLINQSDSSQ